MLSPRRTTAQVRIWRHLDGRARERRDTLVVEEPLEVRLTWTEPDAGSPLVHPVAVIMRTPGDDFELAAGFLYGEGVVARREDLDELTYCTAAGTGEYNVVEVRLAEGVLPGPAAFGRNFYATSSCGVCGKASLDAVAVRESEPLPRGELTLASALVATLPAALSEGQTAFRRTGAVHAAGLFDGEGVARSVREDVGRHNAVDKVVGEAFLAGELPLHDRILVVSGRASFEILQKAVAARVPAVVAVGAPSSLAVELARRFHVTLVGFARGSGFNVYAGRARVG